MSTLIFRDQSFRLCLPAPALREAFLDMVADFRAAGEDRYDWVQQRFGDDFTAYVHFINDLSRGIGLEPEHVPQTTFWLLRRSDQRIVAASRLRHELNSRQLQWGGNIGYDVRPSDRRRGYATFLLSLTLAEARKIGLKRVLLTCDATNAGSIRVIESNGGQLETEAFLPRVSAIVRRYWIQL